MRGKAQPQELRPKQRAPDLPAEVLDVLQALIEAGGDDLSAVLWHGSHARGEAKPDSDHDLIIVLKRADDGVLLRLQGVFHGRENWSTFVQTEEELRQYPIHGRLEFAYGVQPLYGRLEPLEIRREHVLDEIRSLARNIRFECRYRLLHREQEYVEMEPHYRDFQRARNARMLRYAAKLAVMALKARELLKSGAYPCTRDELRRCLTHKDELSIVDIIDRWDELRPEFERDATPLALQLDVFARELVAELDSGALA